MTPLRERMKGEALDIFRHAVGAVDPKTVVERALGETAGEVRSHRSVRVISLGKAAVPMAEAAQLALGDQITGGVAVTKYGYGGRLKRIEVIEAGHPIPDEKGLFGAKKIVEAASGMGPDDLVLVLISGGGSALAPLPAEGLELTDLVETNRLLVNSPADIHEINTVRRHLSGISGGGLARSCVPARVVSLILSDVVGDDVTDIASGPTAPDPTTFRDAAAVIERHGLSGRVPRRAAARLAAGIGGEVPETPKPGDPAFERVTNLVVGSSALALTAAQARARQLGFFPLVLSSGFTGNTHELARFHAAIAREVMSFGRPAPPPACLISGGETTLAVTGAGTGGRNSEFALVFAVATAATDGVFGLFAGSDGTDGPTDAAGAFTAPDTVARAREGGMDPERYLTDNDSYSFFRAIGDLVVTGPTRTNVMDIRLVLVVGGEKR
jgi:glycerate 2-kinase